MANSEVKRIDPFDTKSDDDRIEQMGIPTVGEVNALEQNARVIYQNSKSLEAAEAIRAFCP